MHLPCLPRASHRSCFHLRNLRATISSSEKPRSRLAAARNADGEQALGKASRLVYYLISVDGTGRLIELVQKAREQVDDTLVQKLVQQLESPSSKCVLTFCVCCSIL